ncbi:MAG TPA: MarR family transcriptional regulator [Thermoplasmatales archaeon]|nr:MarR family transcriptional regulator [Thermoplasmatales archaeon]
MGKKLHSSRILFYCIIPGVLLFLVVPCLHAQTYYADLTITVDSSGYVTIDGRTNYPNLTIQNTEQYTSKSQSLWVLNITKQQTFSEFIYTLILPAGSSINYIKTSGFLQIEENLGRLIVKGFGENESLIILVQYQIEKRESTTFEQTLIYVFLIGSIVVVSVLVMVLFSKEKKIKPITTNTDTPKPYEEIKGLNQRQKQIMQLLHESNTPLTQTDIQKHLQIPKASVSRNIRGLERKGLIEKEQIGMSNLVRLKKQ